MSETTQILTATLENFASVVETSRRVPVLIDFWAPWCAPCRALTPVLERIARDYADRLVLAKVNVDEEQELAGQFGVRSIPTVVLVKDGRIGDQFTGVQPDATIRAMLDRHVAAAAPDTRDPVVRAHALAQAGDHAGAIRILEEALAERPDEPVLLAALAGLRLLVRDAAGAESTIAALEDRDPDFPALGTLRARLGFLQTALASPDVDSSSTLESVTSPSSV